MPGGEQRLFMEGRGDGGRDGVFEAIQDALASGDSVALTGFGTFSVKSRPARTGRHPRTGESIEIAALMAPAFKGGKTLRDEAR